MFVKTKRTLVERTKAYLRTRDRQLSEYKLYRWVRKMLSPPKWLAPLRKKHPRLVTLAIIILIIVPMTPVIYFNINLITLAVTWFVNLK